MIRRRSEDQPWVQVQYFPITRLHIEFCGADNYRFNICKCSPDTFSNFTRLKTKKQNTSTLPTLLGVTFLTSSSLGYQNTMAYTLCNTRLCWFCSSFLDSKCRMYCSFDGYCSLLFPLYCNATQIFLLSLWHTGDWKKKERGSRGQPFTLLCARFCFFIKTERTWCSSLKAALNVLLNNKLASMCFCMLPPQTHPALSAQWLTKVSMQQPFERDTVCLR